ncbi:glycosyltransferase family 2 protein [Phenylobacterium hankyongense]|uniref:Glycosyltransferase family 2 protein n=1 Tax=Phenylobacterium hankyongense TaxID=1813876 RepID=A0A328B2W5_9CAUL|nr:glycosyltransferase family A protein [Phenylobacterium hankyongense]RAK60771.1 glycosyltransferase family 2 protein [Phenylobacterium hankyongense]
MSPSVSVVIINHNYGRFLGESVRSVLAQSAPPAEIVVVDDGSTDNSREVIAGFGGAVIPVFQSKSGHVAAFNAGFAKASGDVLIFLDADDRLYTQCVQTVVENWEPGLAKIQYQLDTMDEQGVDQELSFPYFPEDLGPDEVLQQLLRFGTYPWTVSSGCAFSRRFLEGIMPIDADLIFKSPDGYANKLAPLFGAVKSLRTVLGGYRVHGQNAWAQAPGPLRAGPFTRNTRFDIVMHAELRRLAASRGHTIPDFDEICTPNQVEVRALSYRLAPSEHPQARDTRRLLAGLGLRSALRAPNTSAIGRLLWSLWLTTATLAPIWLVSRLYLGFRGQSGRSSLSRHVLNFARGRAGRYAPPPERA